MPSSVMLEDFLTEDLELSVSATSRGIIVCPAQLAHGQGPLGVSLGYVWALGTSIKIIGFKEILETMSSVDLQTNLIQGLS